MNKINNPTSSTVPTSHPSYGRGRLLQFLKVRVSHVVTYAKKHPREFVVELLTYVFLCLWIVVVSKKLFAYTDFRQAMIDQPFEDRYGVILSYLLPIIQLGTAILFIFDKTRRYGFWLTVLHMAVYSWYIVLVLKKTWGFIPCGCTLEFPFDWKGHLWINGIIAAVAIVALLLDRKVKLPSQNGLRILTQLDTAETGPEAGLVDGRVCQKT